ncbi:MAG: hypothetical protein ACRDPS_11850 [Nocardioides sp.]|uniref:hypothetical protein n=1 Tax=Nocardioides sp. TaxID=35761 RepID=UPI003D6C05E1
MSDTIVSLSLRSRIIASLIGDLPAIAFASSGEVEGVDPPESSSPSNTVDDSLMVPLSSRH